MDFGRTRAHGTPRRSTLRPGSYTRKTVGSVARPRKPVIVPYWLRRTSVIACLCVCALLFPDFGARARADLRGVTLQLKWRPQFQFAGYYMADQLGYYRKQGLHVRIKPGGPPIKPSEEV